jgi:asparaginyl-tRNA synthetase
MSTIHIDETTGSDITGSGTADQPYQTLAFALFTRGTSSPLQLLYRKDASAKYEEPTQSSLKKAKKGAEGLEKKRKKQEELAEKEARENREDRERREKLLEESKKIVLSEDSTLPKAVKVCMPFDCLRTSVLNTICSSFLKAKIESLADLRSQRVRVFGWVHRLRPQKDMIFLVLRDGTGYLQAILSGLVVCLHQLGSTTSRISTLFRAEHITPSH